MNETIRAVLFDLDGTLLNTLGDLADATNAALLSAGYPAHPVDAYRRFVGNGLHTLVRRALPPDEEERLGPSRMAQIVKGTGENYARNWAAATRPYAHIPELLAKLRERGIPLGVVTNKPHDWTLLMLDHYFPDKPFLSIQGAMPQLPHKPDPTSALAVARALHVEPEATAFIGDSDVDMHTAHNAGMYGIGAGWGFRGAEELRAAGARHILADPLELLNLL